MNENICAISTSLGVGAISIIRASGPDVISIANKIFKGENLEHVKTHTINYGFIVDKEETIDEVLVSVMRAPQTFTKEDVVEINCHGGIMTTNRVLELMLLNGCRLADRGEFSKKAFLNGRIDLIEAEGINDLIISESEEARRYAMNRVEGNLSKRIKEQREILLSLSADLEVNYDFPEEMDNPEVTHAKLNTKLREIKDNLEDLIKHNKEVQIIKNGIDVAIIGKPNVGKSSILNHLLDQDKAIVTDIAGTTRDIVEGSISLNGIKLNLIDTAGIRETDDVVEKIGVDKSKSILSNADLAIIVLNNNETITPEELEFLNSESNVKKIVFINKDDLESKIDTNNIKEFDIVYGNTINPRGLDKLKEKITEIFNLDEISSKSYNQLSNARQIALVRSALESIENALESVKNEMPFEMISIDIKSAFDDLGEIIGATYKDELIDELFSKFCLGK